MRSGHPWVFSNSIREENRPGEAGELAVIFDRNDRFLALGLYDPDSPIRLRIIHRGKPVEITEDWWRQRFDEAVQKRSGIFDASTNAGRIVNGESDGFPALVLDRYDDTFVIKLYSGIWFPRLPGIAQIIQSVLQPKTIVLRLSRNIREAASKHGLTDAQMLIGEKPSAPVEFRESGLLFEADVLQGQKTGFFLDQRENRRRVESLAAGKDVLNAFSFSGGFSLYAAKGGAKSVTDVDISAHALESSRRNFALNAAAVARTRHELVQANVFEWLQQHSGPSFDLIILDPPSLAKRAADRANALRAYGALAAAGVQLARKNGVLVCCSCSSHIKAAEFFERVEQSARASGRHFRVLDRTHEPLDHAASFPEGEYLKAIYLQLD